MKWKLIALGVVVVLLLGALYWSNSRVVQGFRGSSEPTFTMYYADWCGHCQKAKPDFQDLMAKSPLEIGGRKCVIQMVSPETEPEKAKGKPVRGFPTFLLESPDGKIMEYKGPRTTDGWLEFLNTNLGGNVNAS
jgi:thiol-disulfide isomerase/thioredoxin